MLRFWPITCWFHGRRRPVPDHYLEYVAVPNAPDDVHHVREYVPDKVEHIYPAQGAGRMDSRCLVRGVLLEYARVQLLEDLFHVHLVRLPQSNKFLVAAGL